MFINLLIRNQYLAIAAGDGSFLLAESPGVVRDVIVTILRKFYGENILC